MRMQGRTALLTTMLLAACNAGAEDSGLEALPEGVTLEPDRGKADGQPQFAFMTAMTVANLAYPDPAAAGEEGWTEAQLEEIFSDWITPGGAAESPWTLARKAGPLGYYGPVGPYGPLGVFGPVGNNIWNPSTVISGGVPWDGLAQALETEGGPLSAEGPLGHQGPLNVETWGPFEATWEAAHPGNINAVHLRPGGMASVLGPTGPLGALGPLGPLGPVGAHGFARDDDGRYQPEGEQCSGAPADALEPPCRALELDYDGGSSRRWELVELYDEQQAASSSDRDTSLVVQGTMQPGEPADEFVMTSGVDQWVTLLLVPEFAKFPPFQAVLDVPDMEGSSFCRAPEDGSEASCAPGAIAFQLQPSACLDGVAAELGAALQEVSAALAGASSFEQTAEIFQGFGSSTFEVLGRCTPRLPETVYVRHALEPWRGEVVSAQINPFVCNAFTYGFNPLCRATGLTEVHAVDYDHRAAFDDFDLSVDVTFGQVQGQIVSDSGDVIDWVSVKVPAGTELRASVSLASTWEVTEQDRAWGLDLFIESAQWADAFSASDIEFMGSGWTTRPVPGYRLIAVGSSDNVSAPDVVFGGSYLRELEG